MAIEQEPSGIRASGRHIFIALPAYTGAVCVETFRSLVGMCFMLMKRGDLISVQEDQGNSMIAHSRDMLIAKFLETDCTHMLWVDSDVCFSTTDAMKLIDSEHDFTACVYPQKSAAEKYAVQWATEHAELRADKAGFLEVAAVPAGLMCQKRAAIERLCEHYKPTLWYDDKNAPGDGGVALFSNLHIGTMYWGEDFSFCKRWRDIGGRIWILPEARLGHVGRHMYTGAIGPWLKRGMPSNIGDSRALAKDIGVEEFNIGAPKRPEVTGNE